MKIPRRSDGKCPTCAKHIRHTTSGGNKLSYCLTCIKNIHRVKRSTPLGRARASLYSRRSRSRRLALPVAA